MWPQFVYIALTLVGLGASLADHGKPRTGTHSFLANAIGWSVAYYLLYAGGFFAPLGIVP